MKENSPAAPGGEWLFHEIEGGICIDGYVGMSNTLAVPAAIGEKAVFRLYLDETSLTENCRALLIPEGIREVHLNLESAPGLQRLEFPATARLTASPRGIDRTEWFRFSKKEPVYLGGYYCGTPGGGCGENGRLVIADGTVAIAYGADFHCFWKSITMPDSVKDIDQLSFGDARCLEQLHLPSGVERIGDFAFHFCPRLKRLYLPDSICRATAPFMLCPALREVSMSAACPIKTKFTDCPRLILRSGEERCIIKNGVIPMPVSGVLHACPADGPIIAAGRTYPNFGSIAAVSPGNDIYEDIFGNTVQKIVCSEGCEEICRYYMKGDCGLTEITYDALCRVYMVWDGASEQALPPEICSQLDDGLRMAFDHHIQTTEKKT